MAGESRASSNFVRGIVEAHNRDGRFDGTVITRFPPEPSVGDITPVLRPGLEFLEKLAAVTPRPEIYLVLYHGVLAPHARRRPEVVAYGRTTRNQATDPRAGAAGASRPRYWSWALLMRRAFALDVLRCPRCAGPMQLIATIEDPAVIPRILAQLGLPGAREIPHPPLPLTAAGPQQPALPRVTVSVVP